MSYNPKQAQVAKVALQVQTLKLPFTIAGSATAANVVFTPYNSDVLFCKTAGTNTITVAAGALDSGETVPTLQAEDDSAGKFSLLAKVSETINKIVGAELKQFGGTAQNPGSIALANTTGLTANGDKIVLDLNTGIAHNTAVTLTYCLEISYVAAE